MQQAEPSKHRGNLPKTLLSSDNGEAHETCLKIDRMRETLEKLFLSPDNDLGGIEWTRREGSLRRDLCPAGDLSG